MKLEVLISCMNQIDDSIIYRTNISSDVLVINQCNENSVKEFIYKDSFNAKIINTTDRGLSNSRNLAINNAKGDICLFCDDDEFLSNDYHNIIIDTFNKYPIYDVIAFSFTYPNKRFPQKVKKINYLTSLKISSIQIAIRRKSIISKRIIFNPNYGSGSGNGAGEENLFLYDCLRAKLKILYVPINIGIIGESKSQWFKGFNQKYFEDRGLITKELMGKEMATIYALYFLISKYERYKNEYSFYNAFITLMKALYKK